MDVQLTVKTMAALCRMMGEVMGVVLAVEDVRVLLVDKSFLGVVSEEVLLVPGVTVELDEAPWVIAPVVVLDGVAGS